MKSYDKVTYLLKYTIFYIEIAMKTPCFTFKSKELSLSGAN